jgi:hypothetical protein
VGNSPHRSLKLFDSALACAKAQGAKRLILVSPLGMNAYCIAQASCASRRTAYHRGWTSAVRLSDRG